MSGTQVQPLANVLRVDLEILRILSALGIIWYHSEVCGSNIGYAGLVIFLILNGALSGRRINHIQSLKKRSERLLLPLVFWIPVYGIRNLMKGEAFIDVSRGALSSILCTTSIHLWYLPFAFASLYVSDIAKRATPQKFFTFSMGLGAALILFCSPLWKEWSIDVGPPWAQYSHAMAALFFGLFVGGRSHIRSYTFYLLSVVVIIGAITSFRLSSTGIEYILALPISLFAILSPRKFVLAKDSVIMRLSACSFGVYLVHILAFSLAARLIHSRSSWQFPIVTFIISYLIVFVGRQFLDNRIRRFIFP